MVKVDWFSIFKLTIVTYLDIKLPKMEYMNLIVSLDITDRKYEKNEVDMCLLWERRLKTKYLDIIINNPNMEKHKYNYMFNMWERKTQI